jgi:hypothetical protein
MRRFQDHLFALHTVRKGVVFLGNIVSLDAMPDSSSDLRCVHGFAPSSSAMGSDQPYGL